MWKCKHCNQEFGFKRTTEKANHSRWCKANPTADRLRAENATRRKIAADVKFGKLTLFKVICGICGDEFKVEERENIFPSKENYYCSRSCSNHRGSGLEWAKSRQQTLKHYRTICFAHHEKRCIVCGEANIVAVHHLNENHDDNRPENLIPMCPTHHEYMHSEFKCLVGDNVDTYIRNWKKSNMGP